MCVDLIANTLVARKGLPQMGLGAAFAAPLCSMSLLLSFLSLSLSFFLAFLLSCFLAFFFSLSFFSFT
jgi:hypothetical protein